MRKFLIVLIGLLALSVLAVPFASAAGYIVGTKVKEDSIDLYDIADSLTIDSLTLVGDPTITGNLTVTGNLLATTAATTGYGIDIQGVATTSGAVMRIEGDASVMTAAGLMLAIVDHDDTAKNQFSVDDQGNVIAAGTFTVAGSLVTTGSIDVDGACNLGDTTATSDVAIGNATGNITMLSDNADITLTDTTDNVFQIIQAGGGTLVDIDLGASDRITIGDGTIATTLRSGANYFALSNMGTADAIYRGTGTLVDGLLTVTWATAFSVAPTVVCTGRAANVYLVDAPSTTVANFGGNAAAVTVFDYIAIGVK